MNEEARAKVERRRRTPALAFLIGALLVGAVAVALYLFWPDRAEAPATAGEAVATDDLDLPAPDAGAVRAQVDAALRASPDPGTAAAPPPIRTPEMEARSQASGSGAPDDPPPPLPEDPSATPPT